MTKAEKLAQIEAEINSEMTIESDSVWNNEGFIEGVKRTRKEELSAERIAMIERQCAEVVASLPIYSAKTRENRKWNPSSRYDFNAFSIRNIARLISGIQYAALDHKAQMLSLTGLSDTLVERTAAAFGNLPYYSRNFNVVVDGTPGNAEELRNCLYQVVDRLSVAVQQPISIDVSEVTQARMDSTFKLARIRAENEAVEQEKAALVKASKVII